MTDKQIIIDVCPYQGKCSVSDCKINDDGCFVRQLFEEKDRAERELYCKEQEYEMLKKIIHEAKNSKLDLKSFLVGEAVQNEYEQQLDQLKTDNEELKKQVDITQMFLDACNNSCEHYKQTLTDIKFWARELLKRTGQVVPYEIKQILQKISEVEDD